MGQKWKRALATALAVMGLALAGCTAGHGNSSAPSATTATGGRSTPGGSATDGRQACRQVATSPAPLASAQALPIALPSGATAQPQATLPPDMLALTIGHMNVGETGWTVSWAMWVDAERRLWLIPTQTVSPNPGGTSECASSAAPTAITSGKPTTTTRTIRRTARREMTSRSCSSTAADPLPSRGSGADASYPRAGEPRLDG
jgi:hypothetical protein